MLQALTSKPAGAPKNYECCYVPKPGPASDHNSVVVKNKHSIETGFYCHMAMKVCILD